MGKLLKVIKFLLIFVIFFVFSIFLINFIFETTYKYPENIKYGVSFSPRYARYLNLDWKKVYLQILDDLKVKNLRLTSYWNSLEPEEERVNFDETDFMLSEAQKRGVKVILVVGARQPRWPECHTPDWAKTLSVEQRQQKLLIFVKKVVERYKDYPSVKGWQVENEPFVNWFGERCDKLDKEFLKEEIKLVRDLDTAKRPIVITDTGEWSMWTDAMKSSDILGISLYRKVYNPYWGYTTYPIPPVYYSARSSIARVFFAPNNQKIIVAEFQSEPWVKQAIPDTAISEQVKLFSIEEFKNNTSYAQKTSFDEIYLWGVEWWYWISQHGHPEYLDFARTIFR